MYFAEDFQSSNQQNDAKKQNIYGVPISKLLMLLTNFLLCTFDMLDPLVR